MAEFTAFDKEYAKHINKVYKWMARNKNGDLCVFSGKPHKAVTVWLSHQLYASVCEDDILVDKLLRLCSELTKSPR